MRITRGAPESGQGPSSGAPPEAPRRPGQRPQRGRGAPTSTPPVRLDPTPTDGTALPASARERVEGAAPLHLVAEQRLARANRLARLMALLLVLALVCGGLVLRCLMYAPPTLSTDAARASEIARNVAQGHGFATQVAYPLALGLGLPLGAAPEVVLPPGHVGLLAVLMRIVGTGDHAVVWLACAGLLLCAGLTALAVVRVSDRLTAALAAALILLNVALWDVAARGGGTCWAMAFMAGALLALTMMRDSAATAAGATGIRARLAAGRPLLGATLAGLLFGLAYLSEYALLWGGLVVLWCVRVNAEPEQRRRAMILAVLGFTAVVLPWWTRNFMVARWPWFLLDRYAAMGGSDAFPGTTVFRIIADPGSPYLFLLRHPKALFTNLMQTAAGLYGPLSANLGPLLLVSVTLPFVVPIPGTEDRRWHRVVAMLFGALVLTTAATTAFAPGPYLALLPFAGLAGAHAIVRLTRQCGPWQRWVLASALVVALVAPMVATPGVRGGGVDADIATNLRAVAQGAPSNVLFITDVPEMASWYTGRPAVWLPAREGDLTAIMQSYPGPTAFFLSRNLAQAPRSEQMQPYQTLLLQPQLPQGLVSLPLPRPGDRLLVSAQPTEGDGQGPNE